MSRYIQAIQFTDINNVEFGSFELPDCGKDQIVAETLYTFVSPGTELRDFRRLLLKQ